MKIKIDVDDMIEKDAEINLKYQQLKLFGCEESWHWSTKYKSKEARIYGSDKKTVCFHPHWSNGTAGIMGTTAINKGTSKSHFWEIQISDRIFGTSTMFGIGTKKTCLHKNSFVNLIGMDNNSWGLSHKGFLYHNGKRQQFCRPFRENEPTKIGILYDNSNGNLSFYKDGKYLGVAFTNLNEIKENLYPIISSTAAKTEIVLNTRRRDFKNLQERCKNVIIMNLKNQNLTQLSYKLPLRILNYIQSESNDDDDDDDNEDEDDNDNYDNTNNYCSSEMNQDREEEEESSLVDKRIALETLQSSYRTLRTIRKHEEFFFERKPIMETIDLTI